MSAPKILSVDDSRMIHTLIGKGFNGYDVQLVFASNGQEGLEVAAREMPDVILLDVTMPVMDGIECLGKLKADPALKDIPVIMLTAEAGKENVLKIAKMGVRDYIVKPFSEAGIIDRVSRLVDLKPKGGVAAPTPPAAAAATVAPAAQPSGPKKQKSVTEAIKVLIVEEYPAIIESITKAVSKIGWNVVGCASPAEALPHVAATVPPNDTPDVILISLAFPNKAALSFYASVRSNPQLKTVPVMGLCVKTATFEQNDAKETGFAGSITKPLDLVELPDRLVRAMNLDNTPLFYSSEGDVQILSISQDFSDTGSVDLVRYSRPKLAGFVNAGYAKLIMDLSGVKKFEIPLLRAVASILSECNSLDIAWRIVGSDDDVSTLPTVLSTNQKVAALKDIPSPFQGKSSVDVFPTRAAAIGSF
jgi:two-component system cell cycle response regulator